MTPQADTGELQSDFAEISLPMAAIELSGMRIVAVTPSIFAEGELRPGEVVGRPVLDVVAPADRPRAKLALEALAAGGVDFVRTHGRLVGPGDDEVYTHWVAAVEIRGERVAVAQISRGTSQQTSPLARYLGSEPVELAVGTVNRSWVVSTVSTGIEQLLGISAADFVGRVLLGALSRKDVDRVLRAALKANSDVSVGLPVVMRTGEGSWRDVRAVFGSLAESTDRFFILSPHPATWDLRALKLEEHLRRIAAEVQASGILEVAPRLPALTDLANRARLTPRQWEVLTRLLRGERVSTIAQELFVSESTVRNHLSTIFSHLGVHSQAELMALAQGGRSLPD